MRAEGKNIVVTSFTEKVIKEHKQVDGIINNAGSIRLFTNLNELEMGRIDKGMNINFYGTSCERQ